MFHLAVERGWRADNPVDPVPFLSVAGKVPKPYTDAELAWLLEILPEDIREIAVVAVGTGCRAGELAALTWQDVNFADNTVRIEYAKNGVSRIIPMAGAVRDVLQRLHKAQHSEDGTELLPIIGEGKTPIWGEQARLLKAIKYHVKKNGRDPKKWTQHRLRDTFGTRCFDKDMPAQIVQKLLGHKTISMTLRYAEVREHKLHEHMANFEVVPHAS